MTDRGPTVGKRLTFLRPGWLSKIAWAVLDIYAAGALGFLAARVVVHESWTVIAMLNNVVEWLLLPSLVFAPFAYWRKHWRRSAAYGLVAIIYLFSFGELFLPAVKLQAGCPADQPDCATRLRVMQVNFENDHFDPAIALPIMRNSGADVIAAEEFSAGPAADVKQGLSDVYPYQVQFGDYIPGIGLLSKYPIISAELLVFSPDQFLPHLLATLDVNGVPLVVIVGHPPPPRVDRVGIFPIYEPYGSYDIRELVRLAKSGPPTLLVGDFNITDQADDYHVIRDSGLRDAFREAGWGFGSTWPVGFAVPPLVRIDYIWMTKEFEASAAWAGEANTSDHFPLFADLIWRH